MLNNTKKSLSNLSTLKAGLDLVRGSKPNKETHKSSSLFDDIFETRKPTEKKKKSNESSLLFDILSDLTEEKKERKPSINITIDTRETRRPQPNYYDPFTTNEYSKWNTFAHNARNRKGKIVVICNDNSYGKELTLIENMMCDASVRYRDYKYDYCRSYEINKYLEEIRNGGKYESYVFIGFPLNYTTRSTINQSIRKQGGMTHRELETYINWISYDRIYDSESWIKWYHSDDYRSMWVNNSLCATLSYLCDTEILSNYEKEYLFRKYAEQTKNW